MIEIDEKHLKMVREILQKWLPNTEVRAFGSRVTGKSRPASDLDLAIMNNEPLPRNTLIHLDFDFDDSDIPFRVDISERRNITAFDIEPTEVIWNGEAASTLVGKDRTTQ